MISIIFCGDLRYCPYLPRYTERMERADCAYEVLFWNRAGLKLELPDNYFFYDSASDEAAGKGKKARDFFGFKRWLNDSIRKSKPDGLILLSTLSGVLCVDILKKYTGRYIFDIRDYSYEHIAPFRYVEQGVIKKSYFTAISSRGFQHFLPEYDYVIAHNFNRNEILPGKAFVKRDCPLLLVWNGTVRFFDHQKGYLDALKNDPRFQLVYHGAGTDLATYRAYCQREHIENVVFTGPYDNKNKPLLLQDAAILNNSYGGRSGDQLRFAISNRYYDGLIYRIPQLVEAGGYKGSIVESAGLGLAQDVCQGFADRLYQFYESLDEERFNASCEQTLRTVIREDDIFNERIDWFIASI